MGLSHESDARKSIVALIVVVIAALLIRLFFFHGIFASDQFTYCEGAWNLANHKWDPGSFYEQTSRWGLILPIAILYRLFGPNDFTSIVWPLTLSLGTVVVAYLLGAKLRCRRAGVYAALVTAFFPLEIVFATQPMADGPMSFWLLLALYFFARGDSENRPIDLVLCGVAIGFAYSTKIAALFIAPFFLLGMLWKRRIVWFWLWVPVGLALVVGAEFLVFQHYFSDGLLRLHLAASDSATHSLEITGGGSIPNSVWLYPLWLLADIRYTGPAFLGLLLIAVFRIQFLKGTANLLLWAGVLIAILTFYPAGIHPYQPLYKLPAYMLMFTAPLLVALGIGLDQLPRVPRIAILGIAILCTFPLSYLSVASFRAEQENAASILAFARQHQGVRLFAHRSDVRYLTYMSGFRNDKLFKSFRLPRESDVGSAKLDFSHSFIAVNQSMILRHPEDHYPAEVLNPPWREVARFQRSAPWVETSILALAGKLEAAKLIPPSFKSAIQYKLTHWSLHEPVIFYQAD